MLMTVLIGCGLIVLLGFSLIMFTAGFHASDFFGDRLRDNPPAYAAMLIGVIGIVVFMILLW